MSKIGKYEYPDNQVNMLLDNIRIFYDKIKGKAINKDVLAQTLGHKNANSGTFFTKVADLRRYGLLESRAYNWTGLAERYVCSLSEEDKRDALNNIVMNIPLWKDLFTNLNETNPNQEKFNLQLINLTNCSRQEIDEFGVKIRNLFIEAMSHYKQGKTMFQQVNTTPLQMKTDISSEVGNSNSFTFTTNGVSMNIEKTEEAIKIAESIISVFKNQLDIKDKSKKE